MRRPVVWLLLLAALLVVLSQTDAGAGYAVLLWLGALVAMLVGLVLEIRDLRAARGRGRRPTDRD
jgi:hypothetical protein